MKSPYYFFILFLFTILFVSCNSKKTDDNQRIKEVIVVIPVTIDAITDFLNGVQDEIEKDSVQFEYLSAEGDPGRFETVIKSAILKGPDVLVVFGTQLTEITLGPQFRNDFPKTIAAALSDPNSVETIKIVGVNPPRSIPLAITSDSPQKSYYQVARDLILNLLGPDKKIGIIYTKSDLNAEITATNLEDELVKGGNQVVKSILTTPEDASKVTQSLILKGVDAIFLPHDKNALIKAPTIVKLAKQANPKVPVFSLDEGTVREKGVIAAASVSYFTVGKMTGELAMEILNGKNPAKIPIRSAKEADIYINTTNLKEFNLSLPKTLEKHSIIINDSSSISRN